MGWGWGAAERVDRIWFGWSGRSGEDASMRAC
jgi:hypothetical protein